MANTTNGNGNLVDEFEEAFQQCLNVLTKDDALTHMDKDEIRAEVDQTVSRVIDLARQTEAFFLQKRFLLSALKPELIVKEDILDLRTELVRKEELIKRHYEKINQWQNLLLDLRSTQGQGTSGVGAQTNGVPQGGPGTPGTPGPSVPGGPAGPGPGPGTPGVAMPGNLQQQHQLQLQQQQMQQQQIQQQMQHQQMQQMQMQNQVSGIGSPQQSMFMGARPPFQPALQGPLAYLEKTTSNIGMTDGRR